MDGDVTRFWPGGQPIDVTSQAPDRPEPALSEQPVCFTWLGQTHQVVEITKSWRVDIDWWRARIWRAYFKLSTDTGLLVVIYQDLLEKDWFLQRLYD
jgi:hypothetical protein